MTPTTKTATLPTQIQVPYPPTTGKQLYITVGACRLRVRPGGGDAWVTGTYTDPTGIFPCQVFTEGAQARITQEHLWSIRWGDVTWPPEFDLVLGTAQPFALTLETGAGQAELDFGGVPLTRLIAKLGAGKFDLDFSAPNPQAMSVLDVTAGAAGMDVRNLANANSTELVFSGGAAAYTFDFGGTLLRDTHVRISTGLSSVGITIPSATAASVASESFLGSIEVGDGFTRHGGAFSTAAALKGASPLLRIDTSIALGSVHLRLV